MLKNKIWQFSLALLLLNLIVGGIVFWNYTHTIRQSEMAQARLERSSVLGANGSTPVFSPNYVMSDETFRSTRVFPTQSSVQAYLESVNSPLKNYNTSGQTASYWIFNAAQGVTSAKYGITPRINPAVILAYLEKEQSLLSYKNYDTFTDSENRIKTAMGYGCPDQAKCASDYFGFANQVNWAAYQLELNFQQSATTGGGTQYIKENTIATLDEYNVFLTNQATAAQYRYTPHVYWGNYNLWKILTANGWGVDPTTYTLTQLDEVNLANKDITVAGNSAYGLTREGIDSILRTKFNFGDANESVKKLQQFLRQEGYYTTREINGMYGTITQQAHQAYLTDKGIALNTGVTATQVTETCKALIAREWTRYTEYGEEGKSLQQCLREMKVFDWPINTGYIGDVTLNALVQGRLILGVNAQSGTTTTSSCSTLKTQTWSFGETSERVRQLQACMRADGVFTWPQGDTGYFGPVTQTAYNTWVGTTQSATQTSTTNSDCASLKSASFTFGETSERVRQLQACMRSAGVFTWPKGDTGYYGPVTKEAFAQWTNASIQINFSCAELKTQVWVKGETSERVRQLQACMRSAGVFNWPQGDTGYFGDATEKAIIAWRGYV